MSGPYTLGQLTTQWQQEVGDPNGVYATSAIGLGFFNQIQADFVQETQCLRDTAGLDVTAGVAEYSLASITPRVIEVLDVALPASGGTDPFRLRKFTVSDLDAYDKLWRTRTGQPLGYLTFNEGFGRLRLYPIPDSSFSVLAGAPAIAWDGYYGILGSTSGIDDATWTDYYGTVSSTGLVYGSLTVDYIAGATDLAVSGDYPVIPAEYQEALIWGAVARFFEMRTPIAQVQKAPMYWAKYQAELAQAKVGVKRDFQRKPPRSVAFRGM